MTATPRTPGVAVASLVTGILSLVCFGPLAAVPAVICGHVAKSKIRTSGGTLRGDGLALAGLIMGYISIGLTVILLPIWIAIAIPSFVKARDTARTHLCINNLRQLDGAKEQTAMAKSYEEGHDVAEADVTEYLPLGAMPVCPKGGAYTLNPIGSDPACSVHGTLSEAADVSY